MGARVTGARYQQTGPDQPGLISARAARQGAADISGGGDRRAVDISRAICRAARWPPAAQGGGPGWRPRVAAQGGGWPRKRPPGQGGQGVRVRGSGPVAQGSPDQTGGAIWQPLRVIGGGQAEPIGCRSIGPAADLDGQGHRHPMRIRPSVIREVTRNHGNRYG